MTSNTNLGERVMRAKLRVSSVDKTNMGKDGDSYRSIHVRMHAVAKNGPYPDDGSDENNSFAKWSPSADFTITINNPNLFDKISEGDTFYADFTVAPK